MKALTVIKVALAAGCALTIGCQSISIRDVTSTAVLHSGPVDCHWRQVIWESSDLSRGCDVTVTYRGTAECPARLLTISPAGFGASDFSPPGAPLIEGTPGQATEPAGATPITVRLRNVQTVWLTCGPQGDTPPTTGCSYTIDRVNCSRNADELNLTTVNATALMNFTAQCGDPERTIWSAAQACNVTLRFRGNPACRANVRYVKASGKVANLSTPDAGDLISLINVMRVYFQCGENSEGSGPCTLDIVQTDCPE